LRAVNTGARRDANNRAMFSPTAPDPDVLRLKLTERAAALQQDLRADRGKLDEGRSSAEGVIDQKDQADATIQASVNDAEFRRDLAELAQVQAALQRLDDGRFGWCQDCAEAIAAERLAAQPWAARCLACQTRDEGLFSPSPRGRGPG
jgi:DnaK suppressor protein